MSMTVYGANLKHINNITRNYGQSVHYLQSEDLNFSLSVGVSLKYRLMIPSHGDE